MTWIVSLVGVMSLVTSSLATSALILPPIRASGDEVGLIFIPGAFVEGAAYKQTAQAIQAQSNLRLWIALTGNYTQKFPNPLQLGPAIIQAVEGLRKAGMKGDNFAASGHSLGGVLLASYASGKTPLKAAILMGAYIGRGLRLREYPIPVLTLSGELDGQTRITRIAVDYQELQQDVVKSSQAMFRTPVINIQGSDHAQFASGPMPSEVQRYDLPADIPATEAHARIGIYCSQFLTSTFGTESGDVAKAREGLKEAFSDSGKRFQPLLDVKALDVDGQRSPWAMKVQSIFAGEYLPKVKITNILKPQLIAFVQSKPNMTKTEGGVIINTSAHVSYNRNPFDISTNPESPFEIDVKMKSRDMIAQALNGTLLTGRPNEVPTCEQLNKAAVQLALDKSTPAARQRFLKRGRPITFGADLVFGTGIQWVSQGFQLVETDAGLKVQSPALLTPVTSGAFPGMHYCKCLSPYRAMEWINVDSLRKHKP